MGLHAKSPALPHKQIKSTVTKRLLGGAIMDCVILCKSVGWIVPCACMDGIMVRSSCPPGDFPKGREEAQ